MSCCWASWESSCKGKMMIGAERPDDEAFLQDLSKYDQWSFASKRSRHISGSTTTCDQTEESYVSDHDPSKQTSTSEDARFDGV
ncbi:hypothetical protein F2P81_018922 [Scophthalmus maximus]|uniref:Uncharacterized protein n=1 Tax=Scophthalmus maximus TaxID=52904 RepID=A0A6A4S9H2_SCOMX|nr:hypothetical protein F2P81_018922 [Scophthalmus maximus]